MLERMDAFFDSRLDEYEAHQMSCIDAARDFYRFTAAQLPARPNCTVLDLGCGTGLELDYYYAINPAAQITGVDLAPGMLKRFGEKFRSKNPVIILGSYFDVPFGTALFDAVVSVESLHHFTADEKLPLYQRIRAALKPGGFFLLTDYFSRSDEEEIRHRADFLQRKAEQGVTDDALYHFDTPLTVRHEAETLRTAGFAAVEVLKSWGPTSTLKAR